MRKSFALGIIIAFAGIYWMSIPRWGTPRWLASVAAMRSDLKNLASRQEIFWYDYETYSANLDSLTVVPSWGVQLTLWAVSDSGFAARATHRTFGEGSYTYWLTPSILTDYTGADCVVYYGSVPEVPRTTKKGRTPQVAGDIVCDMDGWSAYQRRLARWQWARSR